MPLAEIPKSSPTVLAVEAALLPGERGARRSRIASCDRAKSFMKSSPSRSRYVVCTSRFLYFSSGAAGCFTALAVEAPHPIAPRRRRSAGGGAPVSPSVRRHDGPVGLLKGAPLPQHSSIRTARGGVVFFFGQQIFDFPLRVRSNRTT